MDGASTSSTRGRSNSLFETTSTDTTPTSRSRSNSLFDDSSSSESFNDFNQRRPLRFSAHNSVVSAMITSNNLRNCREVEEMVVQCLNTKDKESHMCKTAQRYIGGCKK
mmetsp:Transcript_9218/g.19349  ORF Transcript_9218/g.19349 Transcript_9218/m.19349 type:complete len:109 (+) Transcript_9218:174-500(+)